MWAMYTTHLGVHVQLVSLEKLEGQEWDFHLKIGGMELWDQDGDLFAKIGKSTMYTQQSSNLFPQGPHWPHG